MEDEYKRVALVGAGGAGKLFLGEIRSYQKDLRYEPVLFVDDDPEIVGSKVRGLQVMGPISDLPIILREENIDLVLITMPSAPGDVIRSVLIHCRNAEVPCLVVPPTYTNLKISGLTKPRSIEVEDLLNIRPKQLIGKNEIQSLKNRVVLVTGAAGSIGSELVNQLASIPPAKILALDISESGLYNLKHQIQSKYPDAHIEIFLGNICDRIKLEGIFAKHKPSLVFHAAAYKHVPILEEFPREAIRTNIAGTESVIASSCAAGSTRIVVISTDKAVEPISIMGKTKRVAELLAVCNANEKTEVIVVRFGNVLESNGSVIPLFRDQIASGGPVTVTHPDVRRYFMTPSEAAQMVIQACLLGRPGKIYVLDMGAPKSILCLAKDLVWLSGMEVGKDIDIVFTGLRPGEKMCEKLFSEKESPVLKENLGMYEISSPPPQDCDELRKHIDLLCSNLNTLEKSQILTELNRLVNADE